MSAGRFLAPGKKNIAASLLKMAKLMKKILIFWYPDCMEQLGFNQASRTNLSATLIDLKTEKKVMKKDLGKPSQRD